jgi:hypothetical protein
MYLARLLWQGRWSGSKSRGWALLVSAEGGWHLQGDIQIHGDIQILN